MSVVYCREVDGEQMVRLEEYQALHARIAELEKERDKYKDGYHDVWGDIVELRTHIATLTEALREIVDKHPRCDCMDAPGIASAALEKVEGK